MADDIRITNLPDSGSRFRVSLDLAKLILSYQIKDANHREVYAQENVLKVYKACAETVSF